MQKQHVSRIYFKHYKKYTRYKNSGLAPEFLFKLFRRVQTREPVFRAAPLVMQRFFGAAMKAPVTLPIALRDAEHQRTAAGSPVDRARFAIRAERRRRPDAQR